MFVVSEHARDLGTGKLLGRGTKIAQVEYFDHPGPGGRSVRTLPVSGLRPRRLEIQTRVFFVTEEGRWRSGRVVELRDNVVEVQFAPKSVTLIAPAELYIRWSRPIADPAPFLAGFLTEPRHLSNLRRSFLREATLERAAGAGLEGLLASSVELVPHQMNVVRRVLTDPVQRYLLADEVGLGKTIEAAAIIRQHVIDDPNGHRVVVIVPEALVGQWRDELRYRFHLGAPFPGRVDPGRP